MKKVLVLSAICTLILSATAGWAAFPTHYGNANPVDESWVLYGDPGYASTPPEADSWILSSDGVSEFVQNFAAEDMPTGDWQFNFTVKITSAAGAWRPVIAFSDGTKSLGWHFSVADGVGTIYYRNEAGAISPLGTFTPDQFHDWSAVHRGEWISVYLDGSYIGRHRYLDSVSYPFYQCYWGYDSGGAPSVTAWSKIELVAAPPFGSISGTVSLSDFTGDAAITPVKVSCVQSGSAVREEVIFLGANGEYSLKDIPSGAYDVRFTARGFLAKQVAGVSIQDGVDTAIDPVALINGDVDGDNEITSTDLSILGLGLGLMGD